MKKPSDDRAENQLVALTKSLLAMPRKLREDSKIGKKKKPKKETRDRKV